MREPFGERLQRLLTDIDAYLVELDASDPGPRYVQRSSDVRLSEAQRADWIRMHDGFDALAGRMANEFPIVANQMAVPISALNHPVDMEILMGLPEHVAILVVMRHLIVRRSDKLGLCLGHPQPGFAAFKAHERLLFAGSE